MDYIKRKVIQLLITHTEKYFENISLNKILLELESNSCIELKNLTLKSNALVFSSSPIKIVSGK